MSNEKQKGTKPTPKRSGRMKLVDEKFKAEPNSRDELELDLIHAAMNMDRYSQEAFGQIETLAAFAAACLDKPPTANTLNELMDAIVLIKRVAADTANLINVTAEEVGANFRDEDRERRYRAWHKTLISAPAAGSP